jgi:hypothetical protein
MSAQAFAAWSLHSQSTGHARHDCQ